MLYTLNRILTPVLNVLSAVACIVIATVLTLDFGFHLDISNIVLYRQIYAVGLYYFLGDLGLRLLLRRRFQYLISHPTDLFALFPFLSAFIPEHPIFDAHFLSQLSLLIIFIGRSSHIFYLFRLLQFKPVQTLIISFVFAAFAGSLLLSLPISTTALGGINYIDALFTATSAICVTGLVTLDIGESFTLFGQLVILILIQIGGLGIMAFSALFALFFHRRISQKESLAIRENYLAEGRREMVQLVFSIFKFTVLFELLGACLLYFFWGNQFGHFFDAVYYSIFHAISAFCNAGFALFSDSLTAFNQNIGALLTLASLIVVGGIGFPVIFNLNQAANRKRDRRPLRLQSKLTLVVTASLLVIGTLVIYLTERGNTLANFNPTEQLVLAFFHSVSARTAGFNAVAIDALTPATLLFIMILMFIGAAPGSTGGGIKTTTLGLLISAAWHTFRGHTTFEFSKRTITQENVFKALAVATLSSLFVFLFLFIILMTESAPFLSSMFETVSAFGTVGLSTGLTPELSKLGKLFIMLLMYIGRMGPLTVAFALARRKPKHNYAYPEENVIIM